MELNESMDTTRMAAPVSAPGIIAGLAGSILKYLEGGRPDPVGRVALTAAGAFGPSYFVCQFQYVVGGTRFHGTVRLDYYNGQALNVFDLDLSDDLHKADADFIAKAWQPVYDRPSA